MKPSRDSVVFLRASGLGLNPNQAGSMSHMSTKRLMVVYGTRPEAVKMAPIIRLLASTRRFEPHIVVTGQHREMLDQVNRFFEVTPNYDLDIIRPEQTLADITVRALKGVSRLCAKLAPDALVVQGDTTTTFSAALAAAYYKIPVFHVEAGLRTHNNNNPFPEELNRAMTARLAALHFAPTPLARQNLLMEGAPADSVYVTGNTVIDALRHTANVVSACGIALLDDFLAIATLDDAKVILVTLHRRESWGPTMAEIVSAIRDLARRDDVRIVFPVHHNPAIRRVVLPILEGERNILLVDSLPYAAFVHTMNQARLILTDSGGVQEEAPSLGKPVLVLRDTTERPEALEAGCVELIGTRRDAIIAATERLLDDESHYEKMARAINPYGDGFASARICQAMLHFFGWSDKPAQYTTDPTDDFSSAIA